MVFEVVESLRCRDPAVELQAAQPSLQSWRRHVGLQQLASSGPGTAATAVLGTQPSEASQA